MPNGESASLDVAAGAQDQKAPGEPQGTGGAGQSRPQAGGTVVWGGVLQQEAFRILAGRGCSGMSHLQGRTERRARGSEEDSVLGAASWDRDSVSPALKWD